MSGVKLKGMTWSHPRGYDPMVACSAEWLRMTGTHIEWDKRSLQDFESYPVDELARAYDLIVIDHPHVGQITGEGCLTPLDVDGREPERIALADGSVGKSYPSYNWQGRQWAFPIDAATQVQAYRPDLLDRPASTWREVLDLARDGRVLLPLRAPHSLMTFYTLAGNIGSPCNGDTQGDLVDVNAGARVVAMIRELADHLDPECFDMDPIDVSERMAAEGSRIACSPLIYGYVNYSIDGFRPHRLAFTDMPVTGSNGPVGSALGGTGIAVSAFSRNRDAAIDFAYWVASADTQRGLFVRSGGQAGHAAAWEDRAANDANGNFYVDTRRTLEGAWLRPRHDGYMRFQQEGSDLLNAGLRGGNDPALLVSELNALFRGSFG
ncbi:extracellular solute-binding protein [Mesorhizobium sp. CAU 1732]|uniref:extracellular solute-binding protein n=1 Tax=Mesorhizobium sp. CAU 1732 TaxID=3140358 RepID=UPI00326125F0